MARGWSPERTERFFGDGDELLDHPGIDDRAAGGDLADRRHQLLHVADPLLEQVGAPGRALLEQGQRVLRLGVLAEHHHADGGVGDAETLGGTDALVGAGRWHANVGEDHIRLVLVDSGEERREIGADRNKFELLD